MSDIDQRLVSIQSLSKDDVQQGRKTGVEENVKTKIVIPVLELLGYSIESDMDFEHTVKGRKADIALMVGQSPKVLVECKSTEKNLDNHIEQALSYARDKAVPYVILTNGNEFRLYKSFIENVPDAKDRLLMSVSKETIIDQFEELKSWVSKRSISDNTLDKKAKKKEELIGQKVTAPALVRQLREAKQWLISEAEEKILSLYEEDRDFSISVDEWLYDNELSKKKNDDWTLRLANEASYAFLTKLYFYRIAEDNGIVKMRLSHGKLSELLVSFSPEQLIKICWDEIWKIDYHAIFRNSFLDKIRFESDTIKKILYQLTNYNFSKIKHDVLGKVYQDHISREERKSLGQYYTPDWLVKFILNQLPINSKSKILDPACGSGTFLFHAYDALRQKYVDDDFHADSIHNEILSTNLFGKDKNPLATRLTATNLALKDLTKPTDSINVIACDSLSEGLGEWFDTKKASVNEDEDYVKAFQLFPKKYDLILGNPPYFTIPISQVKEKYSDQYNALLKGRTNIASLFLKRYIDRLKDGGYLAFVVPKSLTYVGPWEPIRKYVLENTQIVSILDIKEGFQDVLLEQVVLILRKTTAVPKHAKVQLFYKQSDNQMIEDEAPYDTFTPQSFPLYVNSKNQTILDKMGDKTVDLQEIALINRGIGIQKLRDKFTAKKHSHSDVRVISGKDIAKYRIKEKKYVNTKLPDLEKYSEKINSFLQPKIVAQNIVAQTGDHVKIIASYDSGEMIGLDTVNNIFVESDSYDLKFILGIINSKLASYYLYNFVYNCSVRTMHLEYIKYLPIKKTSLKVQKKLSKMVDEIIGLKEISQKLNESDAIKFETKGIEIQKKLSTVNKNITKLESEIDYFVYEVYGLSDKEIKVIENQR